MTDVRNWSEDASGNSNPSPAGFPEGMAPSGVNNAAREVMAAVKREWTRSHVVTTATGTPDTDGRILSYNLPITGAPTTIQQGDEFHFLANLGSKALASLSVGGINAYPLYFNRGGVMTRLGVDDIRAGDYVEAVFDSGLQGWRIKVDRVYFNTDGSWYYASPNGAMSAGPESSSNVFRLSATCRIRYTPGDGTFGIAANNSNLEFLSYDGAGLTVFKYRLRALNSQDGLPAVTGTSTGVTMDENSGLCSMLAHSPSAYDALIGFVRDGVMGVKMGLNASGLFALGGWTWGTSKFTWSKDGDSYAVRDVSSGRDVNASRNVNANVVSASSGLNSHRWIYHNDERWNVSNDSENTSTYRLRITNNFVAQGGSFCAYNNGISAWGIWNDGDGLALGKTDGNGVPSERWGLYGGGGYRLDVGNAFKPGGGSWGDTSDARVKTDIRPYEAGLPEVLALRPKRYRFAGNDDAHKLVGNQEFTGLIAQDVEAIPGFASMVSTYAGEIDGQPVSDIRRLDTSELVFALVNAVQTLSRKVEELEAAAASKA